MRVMIMTDLEGASGVVTFADYTGPDSRYYGMAKRLLTGEVNAAVEALTAEGVEDVLVIDGHGCGGIVPEMLRPPARLMHGGASFLTDGAKGLYPTYDAMMMIGQHAMAGTPEGNLCHTQSSTSITYYKLNGQMIGETAQWALFCGHFGVPLIFLSGDHAACAEAEALVPGIVTAAVKRGLARESAISIAPEAAQELIRRQVRQAVRNHRHRPLPPVKMDPPYELEVRFTDAQHATNALAGGRWEKVDDRTVRRRAQDIVSIIYG